MNVSNQQAEDHRIALIIAYVGHAVNPIPTCGACHLACFDYIIGERGGRPDKKAGNDEAIKLTNIECEDRSISPRVGCPPHLLPELVDRSVRSTGDDASQLTGTGIVHGRPGTYDHRRKLRLVTVESHATSIDRHFHQRLHTAPVQVGWHNGSETSVDKQRLAIRGQKQTDSSLMVDLQTTPCSQLHSGTRGLCDSA